MESLDARLLADVKQHSLVCLTIQMLRARLDDMITLTPWRVRSI